VYKRQDKYEQLFYARHGENCEAATYFQNQAGYNASHINWRAEKVSEVDYYMSEVYKLGYRGEIPPPYCAEQSRPKEGQKNEFNNPANNFDIGFCNGFFAGSKWQWERKGWPYFPELAKLLKKYYPKTRLHLLGRGKAEEEWARTIDTGKDWIQNKVGEYDIHETIWRLGSLDLFITTDTGLMHIADARNVPMVILFGPTLVSKNGPYNREHRIARSPTSCAPCQQNYLFYSCKDWKCMKELKPWMVMSVIREYVMDLMKQKNRKYVMEDREATKSYDRKKAIGDWKRVALWMMSDLTKVKNAMLY